MSIKQSIATLLVLLSFSFSAYSQDIFEWKFHSSNSYCGYDVVYADASFASSFSCSHPTIGEYYDCRIEGYSSQRNFVCSLDDRGKTHAVSLAYLYVLDICPDGTELVDGECVEPPPPPFCSEPSTIQQMRDFESSCFDDGGSPTIICNDQVDPPDFRMSCDIEPPPPTGCEPGSPSFPACLDDENKCDENHPDWDPRYGMCCSPENNYCDVPPPESCTIFSANYPACMGDNDITPPDSGDLGDPSFPDGGGSGGNGSGSTDSNKPQPDVDNTSDELSAIKSMNDDLNSQLNAINNDMNKNQAETKSALDALKASTDLNTQSVIDGANHVAGALDGQSEMLSGIGNKTNQYLKSINTLLNNGFGELANGLNGVGSGLDGLSATNQQGFGDVISAIEGLGEPMVNGGNGSPVMELYSGSAYTALQGEVDILKAEYEDMLNQYRSYFSFSQAVDGGSFNSHDIDLNWHGTAINKSNQVMASMRDNAGIISAVVLFIFGMMGIRAISGAF
ncbi:chemotaxis protein [Vibrio sp. dhg]|uniref:chemotaxis protein n=1 Tax=Vibrio sp. dhg TaxID=2163016 RepID=UPI000E53ED6F|nr:chemotaxis protein [Vibrio sp. dhg]AXT70898.1 chemotaxis protein [Vibrio sp. dhg]